MIAMKMEEGQLALALGNIWGGFAMGGGGN